MVREHSSLPVALYLRASTARQSDEGYTLDFQLEHLNRHAESNGYDIVRTYVDAGESGKTIDRPGFQQMVGDARQGLFTRVLVYRWDRFSRKLSDLVNVVESLARRGIKLESVTQASDENTPEGRLMRNILGSFAQFESEQLSIRVKDGMVKRAEDGLWLTRPPFGYRMVNGRLEVEPQEAQVVRQVFQLKDQGHSMTGIARDLNQKGIRSKAGGPWQALKIQRILANPVYKGYCMTKEAGLVQGHHEPILSGSQNI